MRALLRYCLVFTLICLSKMTFAHALWIETSAIGIKGKAQEVKIFYGEYAAGELEPVDKWYSDVKDFKLILTTPAQQQVELTKEAAADYFIASFTPEEDGLYTLSVVKPAKDLGGTTRYDFSSIVRIAVGKSAAQSSGLDIPLYVQVSPAVYKKNTNIEAVVLKEGKVLADAELIVMSQEGWTKVFKTNSEGKVSFPALWTGNYVLEASHSEAREGSWHDKEFKRIWQGATTFIQVK